MGESSTLLKIPNYSAVSTYYPSCPFGVYVPENRMWPSTNVIRDDKINLILYTDYDFKLKHNTQDAIVCSHTLYQVKPSTGRQEQM